MRALMSTAVGGLVMVIVVIGTMMVVGAVLVIDVLSSSDDAGDPERDLAAATRSLPPYWTVRPRETLVWIADKTGLTVEQLEELNPQANPGALVPGQRLRLRPDARSPRPKLRTNRTFWIVRRGDTLSGISSKTGVSMLRIEELNRKLKPDRLMPGQRIRLKRKR